MGEAQGLCGVGRHIASSLCDLTISLSREEERYHAGYGENSRQRTDLAGLVSCAASYLSAIHD